MAEKNRVFVDMDGTLAQFKYVAFEQLLEPGYYRNLEPMENTVQAVKELIKRDNVEVFIMSAVLREAPTARDEKNAWLDEFLPEIDKDHRCFMFCDEVKAEHIPGGQKETDLLLDDYTHNLDSWAPPGLGVKLLNGLNDTNGTWQKDKISFERDPKDIATRVEEISMGIGHTYDRKLQEEKRLLLSLQPDNDMSSWLSVLLVRRDNEIVLFFGHNEKELMKNAGLDSLEGIPHSVITKYDVNVKQLSESILEMANGNKDIEDQLHVITDYFIDSIKDDKEMNLRPMQLREGIKTGISFDDYKVKTYMINKKEPVRMGEHDKILFNKETGKALGFANINLDRWEIQGFDIENNLLDSTTSAQKDVIAKLIDDKGAQKALTLIIKNIVHAPVSSDICVLDDEKLTYTMGRLREHYKDEEIERLLGYQDGKIDCGGIKVPVEMYPDRDTIVKNAWQLINEKERPKEVAKEQTKEVIKEQPKELPKNQDKPKGKKFGDDRDDM